MSAQWGEPGLSPVVVAQIDSLLDECRSLEEGRRLQRAGVLYVQRVNEALRRRVAALEAFIVESDLEVPPEVPVAAPGAPDPA